MKTDNVLVTADGLVSLKKELDELKNHKLPEVISRVAKAREDGDLSENSAYQFGKQEQEFLEGRIEELEEILSKATLIKAGNGDVVGLGCKVTVSVNGKKQIFDIVGDWEAKPAQMKISGGSPLGKALLGKKIGEKTEVEAPVGKLTYTIIEIQ
ncbi:transcription elongation factor GreA [Candidatus Gottesmanbacteria bacterium]|nr:transcription elongation factor GreA [Candidatus Gottesmanbacteria bacterium]